MEEHYTRGVIIERVWEGERDASVLAYTKDLGKVRTKVRGVQRNTSKLIGHIAPGRCADMRFVGCKNGSVQLVDALTREGAPSFEDLQPFLCFLGAITAFDDPDERLWGLVEAVLAEGSAPKEVYRLALGYAGFCGEGVECSHCADKRVAYFIPSDISFLCIECARRSSENGEQYAIEI